MTTIAIVGANGFIGSRTVEMLHLTGQAAVRPVVRTASSLARLSRFDLDSRVADARDEHALAAAISGCEAVVHTVSGSPDVILSTLAPVYLAAQQAGVQRLIYLSSASVHGQNPPSGTNEDSPLHERHPIAYNNAKVRAERILERLRERGRVEVVILRPGIVFGPRSYWVGSFADALLKREAYLVNDGQGICNSVYVDNLIHAVIRAICTPGADGETFLVGDRECVTWRDLYTPIASVLGYDLDDLPSVDPIVAPTWRRRFDTLRKSRRAKALASLLPRGIRHTIAVPPRRASPFEMRSEPPPRASLEMSLLHTCQYKLPHEKAERLLSYNPPVSFAEGCRRTVGWLAFAGYPVVDRSSDWTTT